VSSILGKRWALFCACRPDTLSPDFVSVSILANHRISNKVAASPRGKFEPPTFVFNKLTASFLISVLRVSWTYCRHETEKGNGQPDSLPRRALTGRTQGEREKEGRTWGTVAYSRIIHGYSALG